MCLRRAVRAPTTVILSLAVAAAAVLTAPSASADSSASGSGPAGSLSPDSVVDGIDVSNHRHNVAPVSDWIQARSAVPISPTSRRPRVPTTSTRTGWATSIRPVSPESAVATTTSPVPPTPRMSRVAGRRGRSGRPPRPGTPLVLRGRWTGTSSTGTFRGWTGCSGKLMDRPDPRPDGERQFR